MQHGYWQNKHDQWDADNFHPPLHQVVVVDVRELGRKSGNLHRKLVVDRALKTKDQDNERFYKKLRARMERCAS